MCLYLNDKLSGLMTGGSWQPADASPPTIYKKKFKVQIIGPLLKGIYTLYLYVFDICISFVHATDLVFFKCSLTSNKVVNDIESNVKKITSSLIGDTNFFCPTWGGRIRKNKFV